MYLCIINRIHLRIYLCLHCVSYLHVYLYSHNDLYTLLNFLFLTILQEDLQLLRMMITVRFHARLFCSLSSSVCTIINIYKHIRSSCSSLSCSFLLHPYHFFSSPPILVPCMTPAGHLDDQEEVPDFTSCMFCGDHDSKWNEDALDLHYWKVQCVFVCV